MTRCHTVISKIVVVDDYPEVRELVRIILAVDPTLQVLVEIADGREAVQVVDKVQPHIVLMDIELPGLSGYEATQIIVQQHSSVSVVMLSTHEEEYYVRRALDVGAQGYVVKRAMGRDLVNAISAMSRHECYVSPHCFHGLSRHNSFPRRSRADPVLYTTGEQPDIQSVRSIV